MLYFWYLIFGGTFLVLLGFILKEIFEVSRLNKKI